MPILCWKNSKKPKIYKKKIKEGSLQKGFLIMKMSILINFDINAGIKDITAQEK